MEVCGCCGRGEGVFGVGGRGVFGDGGRGAGGGGEMSRANGVRDVALGEWSWEVGWERFRVFDYGVPDRGGHFVLARVGEADIQYCVAVVLCEFHGTVDGFEHVGLDELALAQDADAGAVALEDLAVLRELGEFDFEHVHKGVDFIF